MTYADLAKQYELKPGTTTYFRIGHASGLGGKTVYIPLTEAKLLSTVELPQGSNTK